MDQPRMQNPLIEGQRLYLRPLEPQQDYDKMALWASSEEMRRHFNVYPINDNQYKERISHFYRNVQHIPLGVAVKTTNELIGVVGLKDINTLHRTAEFYIKIDQEYQGQGYGTEATRLMLRYGFIDLNLNRIQTQDAEINMPGWKVDEKLGFQYEGLVREAFQRGGFSYNVRLYSMLRSEYMHYLLDHPLYTDEREILGDFIELWQRQQSHFDQSSKKPRQPVLSNGRH